MEEMDLREYGLNIRESDLLLLVERFKGLRRKVVGHRKDVDARFGLLFCTGGFLDLAQ
jgi:ribosomal protein S15P/S13E